MTYRYPLVEIVWDDAESDSGWHSTKYPQLSPAAVTTVGFVIHETKKHVLVGHTYSGEYFIGWLQIPKQMIISRKTLKRAKRT